MSQVCSVLSVRDCVGLKDIEMLVGAEKSNIPGGIPIREVCWLLELKRMKEAAN